jgi:sigma-B regulation protein RsbU (phosphoserine phosphatase)
MAIMHAIAHAYPGQPTSPAALMTYINRSLASRYTASSGAFITAFYGVYDPAARTLTYSSAGHNPPRLRLASTGEVVGLDAARDLPLGIREFEEYRQATVNLAMNDVLVLYTDGITEAWSTDGQLFGVDRLDGALRTLGGRGAAEVANGILGSVAAFSEGRAADDDRTLLAGVVG